MARRLVERVVRLENQQKAEGVHFMWLDESLDMPNADESTTYIRWLREDDEKPDYPIWGQDHEETPAGAV